MAATVVRGAQIKDGTIQRADVDVGTVGQALITKALQGSGIAITSTGADAGTGDVTVNLAAIAADSILGNTSASTAVPAALTALPFAYTGDVTRPADSNVTTLAAGNAGNLNSGTLLAARMPALTGDVTMAVGTTATTLVAGNAGNLNSGTLLAARMPALTGDVTTSAGAVATTIGANKVTLAMMSTMATGSILGRATAATGNVEVLTSLPWGYTGDVTSPAGSNVNTLVAGNAGNLNSGTLLAARMPALTGDIISTVGTVATTYNNAVPTTKGGLPTGGTTGQVLSKIDATNYNTQWITPAGGGNVSTSGTITTGQYPRWASATTIESVTVATLKTDLALTKTDVGLSAVTNDAQTKAAVVPNTLPLDGQLLIGATVASAYTPRSLTNATISASGVLTGVTNAALSNSAITIGNAGSISLGGTATLDSITGISGAQTGLVKHSGANTLVMATAGTDYQAPITGISPISYATNQVSLNVGVNFNFTSAQTINIATAAANTSDSLLILQHTSSGIVAGGFGSTIWTILENSSGVANADAGQLQCNWSTPGPTGSEVSYYDFQLRNASALASKMRIHGSGGLSVGHTTDPLAGYISANTGFKIGATDIFPLTTARAGVPNAGAAGRGLYKNTATDYDYSWKQPASFVSAAAVATAGTVALTPGVHAGLAASITPTTTGRVLVTCSGYVTSSGVGQYTAVNGFRYGTGTAPAHGAAPTGTAPGSSGAVGHSAAALYAVPFSITGIITGLTVGTAYWVDVIYFSAIGTSTSKLNGTSVSIMEF
jgi:hypothetical protein